MADNIAGRSERPDLDDNDPFAELTRIMGHDPRQDQQRVDESDFALDLENELLGDLDLGEYDEPVAAAEPAVADTPHVAREPHDEPAAPVAPQAEAFAAPQAETYAGPTDEMVDELDFSDLDAELGAAFDTGLDDEPALPAEDEPTSADVSASSDDPWSESDYAMVEAIDDLDFETADDPVPAARSHDDWQTRDTQPERWAQPPEVASVTARDDEAPASEQEPSGGDLSNEGWGEAEVDSVPSAVAMAPQPEEAPLHEEAAFEEFEFDEEFMSALEAEPVRAEPSAAAAFAAEEPAGFDTAEAAPFEDSLYEPAEAVADEEMFVAEAPEPVSDADQSQSAPQPLSLEEELTMLLAGADKPGTAAAAEPAAHAAHAAPAMPRAEESVVQAAAPVAARVAWPSRPAAADRDVPEIETVEMTNFEPIRSAEFEIPDLPVDEPVKAASEYDDLTAELSRAFELGDDQPDRIAEEAYAAEDAASGHASEPEFEWDTAVNVGPGNGQLHADDAETADPSYYDDAAFRGDFQSAGAATGFAAYRHDDDLADDMDGDRPVLRDNRRRNMMVAGGAVALLLLGGVGVFALWSGGGAGGGEPVFLQADGEPVRVRPEEPGGTVVPNQDNEVYQRVAGGREEAEPSQTRLIDTAEEPIDLTVQNAPRIVGPGADSDAGFGSDLSAVKVDDRLDAASGDSASNAADDVVALQPRRVRTMVVRPDGSIVPREEEASAAPESAPAPVQQLAQPDNAAAQAPSAPPEETVEAAAAMPEEIQLAPAARPAEQQPAAAAPTPAPQPEQQVAAVAPTPAAPQATQTSEWSMQIASQPSSESAQATYQDLARRYSSLLEGRGVNIVSAQVDGRTFYRVRIPMATRDEAVNLCTRYQQAGGSCFVSR
ncbi:hypothetical protein GRZ55_04875 [Chelativorans sp. ZYF759]|uniref:SPOR domain-containing protein n=1 Tax=Chelativorans sp. ZYF759 TaxID=2692213 RepID=UPI00145EC435|nr:SPOR domain-containing protein [Chelativorans sp. ZYF759]NMG38577.1 hypothetical protein [Chelativorans sp. ZYF759]